MIRRQTNSDHEKRPITFKRIARIQIGTNREASISLASNDSLSIVQFGRMELDAGDVKMLPLRGSFRISRGWLINFHHMLTWVILRYAQEDIPERDRTYIQDLKKIFTKKQIQVERDMRSIGFAPTKFAGQSYENFPQQEEEVKDKW